MAVYYVNLSSTWRGKSKIWINHFQTVTSSTNYTLYGFHYKHIPIFIISYLSQMIWFRSDLLLDDYSFWARPRPLGLGEISGLSCAFATELSRAKGWVTNQSESCPTLYNRYTSCSLCCGSAIQWNVHFMNGQAWVCSLILYSHVFTTCYRIIIIVIITLFQEDNMFGMYASLTYGPQLQR